MLAYGCHSSSFSSSMSMPVSIFISGVVFVLKSVIMKFERKRTSLRMGLSYSCRMSLTLVWSLASGWKINLASCGMES